MKKILALVLAALMLLSMTAALADTTGSITISNAAKGETYTIYKLFDATVDANDNSKVAYKGTIPSSLTDYFEYTSTGSGYIQAKKAAFKTVTYYTDETKGTTTTEETAYWSAVAGSEMSTGLKTALTTWANSQTSNQGQEVADGGAVVFSNLPLGYYVVTTSQGDQAISVDTTNLNPSIIDKNSTTPTVTKKINGKDVDDASIGDTVTFTATFNTANWIVDTTNNVENDEAEQVMSYTIKDTLPDYLSNIQITGLTITQTTIEADKATYPDVDLSSSYTAFTNKKIVIPWVDNSNPPESLYKNGSVITLTYTAEVTDVVNVNGANINTVTLIPNHDKTGDEPFERHYQDDAELWTYGAALQKTDENGNNLAGAQFTIAGLTVTEVSGEPGVYMVASYNSSSSTASAVLSCNSNGQLYILGLDKDARPVVTEYKAPDGYNKLTTTTNLVPEELSHKVYRTSRDEYYDAKGNLLSTHTTEEATSVTRNYTDLQPNAVKVQNNKGVELPSTGGIGTTIFYIGGSILVLAAAILLITKRRMGTND